ncbi:MAG: hypothetical protein VCF08_01125 [Alphaproteobacteria bacterium]
MAEGTVTYGRLGFLAGTLVISVAVMIALTVYQMRRTETLVQGMANANDRLATFDGAFARLDHRLDVNDENISTLRREIESALGPNTRADFEPSDVLGAAGIPMDEWYFSLRIKDQSFIFPRNDVAARQLRDLGFKEHRITPHLTGYRLD